MSPSKVRAREVRSSILRGTAKINNEMLGSPVTPPALGAGELVGSNPTISTTQNQGTRQFFIYKIKKML
jgi:hypothetical protein